MKETIKYRRSSWTYTERSDRPLLLWEIGRTTSFHISYRHYWLHIYTMCKISYNTLTYELNFHMHCGILRLYWCHGQERIQPISLELHACDLVVGVHSASPICNLNKGDNTYIWIKLIINDCNKIILWIFLLTHFILSFRVAPPILGRHVVDELADVVSTVIISGFLPQALYEK